MASNAATRIDAAQIRRALGLFHSIALSVETMSPQAEDEYRAALAALKRLEANQRTGQIIHGDAE